MPTYLSDNLTAYCTEELVEFHVITYSFSDKLPIPLKPMEAQEMQNYAIETL